MQGGHESVQVTGNTMAEVHSSGSQQHERAQYQHVSFAYLIRFFGYEFVYTLNLCRGRLMQVIQMLHITIDKQNKIHQLCLCRKTC